MTDAGGPRSFGYKPALDGLRAVAVMAVIVYHLGAGWARGGYLGVDAFFVLSGFLITSLLLIEFAGTGRIDLRAFWIRRAKRLLPAMLLVLAGVAVWAAVAIPAEQLGRLRGDSLATLIYGANWRFVATGHSYFDLATSASPLEHMWSLAIEEQFYLVWPLVAFGALAICRGRPTVLAIICIVGTFCSVAAMALLYDSGDPSRAYYGTDTRAHALLIGAILAIVLHDRTWRRTAVRRGMQALGVAGGITVIVFMTVAADTSSWMYRGGFVLFALAVAAVITAAVTGGASPVRALLALAPLVWIGRISYGLYLWHWPVQTALSEGRTGLHGTTLDLMRILTTFALATASFYAVEQPIRRGALSRRTARLGTPVALAGVATAIVLVTASAAPPPSYLQHAGDVDRVSGQILAASQAAPMPSATPAPTTATTTTPATAAAAATSVPFAPRRILLVGDSIASSLLPGIEPEAARRGVALFPGPIPGCGVLAGTVLGDEGEPIEWATRCSDKVVQKQREWVDQTRPDLVIWYSSWETADRVVDGEIVRFGTAEGNAVLLRLIDEAVARLTSTGAKVVFPTMPPPVATPEFGEPSADQIDDVAQLNALLGYYARVHPHLAFVVDLAEVVCPGGHPCPPTVDGVAVRPKDGRHYDDAGPAWVASRLLDVLLQPRMLAVAP